MEYPQAAIDALKQDFDTALVRLDSAVALGERKGVIVDDEPYAPAGLAHHDREQAVRGAVVAVLPVAMRALGRSRTRRTKSAKGGAGFGAVGALEQDFDAALVRLESAVARGEDQGLVVEDQCWAPVYRARHDREEAIRILRTMLAPMRDDPADILREDTEHEELTP